MTRPASPPAPQEGQPAKAKLRFAFLGRVSTEDHQDPEASRAWQLRRANALIEPHGEIVVEFFDVDKSRSVPWRRRPQASALLEAFKDPNRGFDAVVIGEPHRAFYGAQYGQTFPLFLHYGVTLWVPEVGGAIDPENEAHEMIMSLFAGLSKGERNRIKQRVRTSMAAITATEGRYLGGRPPYGYMLVDAGPHPHPGKAADGKRLRKLVADPLSSLVVRWLFAEYAKGRGREDLADELTRQGVACPSAYDPERNRHRCKVSWSKSAIKAILANPRYTGYQVWNKQHKHEVLIDTNDVGLGHITKMQWNDKEEWVWSERPTHEALVTLEDFERVQQIASERGRSYCERMPRASTRPYALRGRIRCGFCGRKMQGHWINNAIYYRCSFTNDYSLEGGVTHPKNVYVREDKILRELDAWLATTFDPARIEATITILAREAVGGSDGKRTEITKKLTVCDRRLNQYKAALEAGADAEEVTGWINTAKQEQARLRGDLASLPQPKPTGPDEIAQLLNQLGDLTRVISQAEPEDKAELYRQLGLSLTYRHDEKTIEALIVPDERRTSPATFRQFTTGPNISTDLKLDPLG